MTRDEQRASIIEAMAKAFFERHRNLIWENQSPQVQQFWKSQMTIAFDAQHGLARVDPIEATEEMIKESNLAWLSRDQFYLWRAMSAVGDLTNPPKG